MILNILLINPFFSLTDFETPLGLLYIAQVLRDAGYKVKLIDLAFGRGFDYLGKYITSSRIDVVGIYSMTPMIKNAFYAAEMVKSFCPRVSVIFGGPHPTLMPQEVLSNKNVDFVVIGEGEATILELLRSIGDGKSSYADIRGIGYKDNGSAVINERREFQYNLDIIPFPDRSVLDTLEGYISLAGIKVVFGCRTLNMIASRGCHFSCRFCQPALREINGDKVRYRSVDNVAEEIFYLKRIWKIDAIWFEDDTITFNKDWVHKLCKVLIKRRSGIAWSCNSRLDTVNEDLLADMKQAGCVQIRYGLESGSQSVLDYDFAKGISLSRAKKVFQMTHGAGIRTYAYVMIGGRHETLNSIKETEHFLTGIAPNHIQLAITTPLPGTRLKKEMEEADDVKILSGSYEDIKLFEKCNFDTKYFKGREIEDIHRRMFNKFHFFKLSGLINKRIFSWVNINFHFIFFLYKIRNSKRQTFILKLFLFYVKLAVRLLTLHLPLIRNSDRAIFKARLSFPYLE